METRPWGTFDVLHEEEKCKIKRVVVESNQLLSLQSHEKRNEMWFMLQGSGQITLDDEVSEVSAGMAFFIPASTKHRIKNTGAEQLVIIEVQTGVYFGEDDIVRYEDAYGRV